MQIGRRLLLISPTHSIAYERKKPADKQQAWFARAARKRVELKM